MIHSAVATKIAQVLRRHAVKIGLGLGGSAIAGTGLYLYANKIEPRPIAWNDCVCASDEPL